MPETKRITRPAEPVMSPEPSSIWPTAEHDRPLVPYYTRREGQEAKVIKDVESTGTRTGTVTTGDW